VMLTHGMAWLCSFNRMISGCDAKTWHGMTKNVTSRFLQIFKNTFISLILLTF
jgi:hypothetical protein